MLPHKYENVTKLLKDGKPELMTLPELVKNYVEHCNNILEHNNAEQQKHMKESVELRQYEKKIADNYHKIIAAKKILTERDYRDYLRRYFNFDLKDALVIDKMSSYDLFVDYEFGIKSLESIRKLDIGTNRKFFEEIMDCYDRCIDVLR